MNDLKEKNIVLGITGSIAAYKACDIVRGLIKEGANVECILTKSAAEFIKPLTLQTLSKNRVHGRMFDKNYSFEIEHISLSKKADLILIAPASADTIARLAAGRADNLLSCVVLASLAKVMICPAMNVNMYKHKATQNNLSILKSYGYFIVDSDRGELACGDIGEGRLASIETIISQTIKCLN
jgi:phosphopantothenoylcysteine decarboxylase/phosphopantothenate--cysteine ligase